RPRGVDQGHAATIELQFRYQLVAARRDHVDDRVADGDHVIAGFGHFRSSPVERRALAAERALAKRGGGAAIDLARRPLHFWPRMVRSFRIAALLALSTLAACTAVPSAPPATRAPAPHRPRARAIPPTRPAPPPKPVFRAPEVQHIAGLEAVIDKDARALVTTFGTPVLDVH